MGFNSGFKALKYQLIRSYMCIESKYMSIL